eukprot:9482192-Pyramimonas_sp.AAC.3
MALCVQATSVYHRHNVYRDKAQRFRTSHVARGWHAGPSHQRTFRCRPKHRTKLRSPCQLTVCALGQSSFPSFGGEPTPIGVQLDDIQILRLIGSMAVQTVQETAGLSLQPKEVCERV